MKLGFTPADPIKDEYIRMEVYDKKRDTTTIRQPHNANGRFTNANIPLRSAFAQSINTIAVKLGQEVGIDNVVQTAHDMGIRSPLDATPSLPGSSDVNLFEPVNAYGTVANDGMYVEPVLVTKIVDADGEVVFEAPKVEKRALPQTAAFYMQKLLEAGVRDGGGTSQTLGAGMYPGPFAANLDMGGKTGTSNNHSDAWFVGVTPNLVGGAWVGGEYRSIHFRTGRLGQGSRTALPIVAKFMRAVMDDPNLSKQYLHKYGPAPEGIDPSTYAATYYQKAEPDSTATDSTFFAPSDEDLMGIGADHSDLLDEENNAGEEKAASQTSDQPKQPKQEGNAESAATKRESTDNLFD